VISGDGHIPEFACLQCHNKREILEARYTPEFLHRNHVTNHKVECFTCHSPIKHQITGLHYRGQPAEACSGCHQGGEHQAEVSMYMGKGARFVPDRPNRMAVINMDCDVCHQRGPGTTPQGTCRECHGGLTDGMIQRWKGIVRDGQENLLKEISAAKAAPQAKSGGRVTQTIKDAEYNYNFIKNGHGVHNIVYTAELMEATEKALRAATGKGKDGGAYAGVGDSLSCSILCHGRIAEKKGALRQCELSARRPCQRGRLMSDVPQPLRGAREDLSEGMQRLPSRSGQGQGAMQRLPPRGRGHVPG
jgi:hypothetical protein